MRRSQLPLQLRVLPRPAWMSDHEISKRKVTLDLGIARREEVDLMRAHTGFIILANQALQVKNGLVGLALFGLWCLCCCKRKMYPQPISPELGRYTTEETS